MRKTRFAAKSPLQFFSLFRQGHPMRTPQMPIGTLKQRGELRIMVNVTDFRIRVRAKHEQRQYLSSTDQVSIRIFRSCASQKRFSKRIAFPSPRLLDVILFAKKPRGCNSGVPESDAALRMQITREMYLPTHKAVHYGNRFHSRAAHRRNGIILTGT